MICFLLSAGIAPENGISDFGVNRVTVLFSQHVQAYPRMVFDALEVVAGTGWTAHIQSLSGRNCFSACSAGIDRRIGMYRIRSV